MSKVSRLVPKDYWPCACIKRDRAGNMTAIRMNAPEVKKCRRCFCTPEGYRPTPAERARRGR